MSQDAPNEKPRRAKDSALPGQEIAAGGFA